MSLSNKEIQQRRNCQLYVYVLESQNKEVPDNIQECADSDAYNYLIDCSKGLSEEIQNFDSETYERIVNNKQSTEAQQLAQWWEMYQMYIPTNTEE